MGKNYNFLKYNQYGEIIEIIVRDSSGAKLASFKFNMKDKKAAGRIFGILDRKYGFSIGAGVREGIQQEKDDWWG